MSNIQITLEWGKSVDLGLTGEDRKLDIFFQPGLSWAKGGTAGQSTKVIALFFLENNPGAGASGMDFQRLAKAMLRWIWAVAGNTDDSTAQPSEYYQALYEAFLAQPNFNYTQFLAFLKQNFEFRIQEPVNELEGTIFPMFPMLILDVGKNPDTIPPQYPVTQKGLQDGFGNLTAQFAFDHVFLPPSSIIAEESARELIFVDYGQLLLRTALQELQGYLPPAPELPDDPIPTIGMNAVITAMEADNVVFDRLASIASRFLLHGLRLPVSSPISVKPIFEVTGQQFNLETAKDNSTDTTDPKPDYVIKLSRPPAQSTFLEFVPPAGSTQPTNELSYLIDLTESTDNRKYLLTALIEGLGNLMDIGNTLEFKNKNGEVPGIAPSDFYRPQKRIFPMHKWIKLKSGTTNPAAFLLQVPTSLREFLAQTTTNPPINLYSSPAGKRLADPFQTKVANSDYNWAVQIDIMARQVSKTDEDGFLTGIFELAGISESQINLLESVIQDDKLNFAHIQVLSGTDELTPLVENLSQFALIRHNFATNGSIPTTAPTTTAPLPAETEANDQTRMDKNKTFLRLLWEGATLESGGYFFSTTMAEAAHKALLGAKTSILLSLLIEYNIDKDPIFDFHNTVVLKKQTDPDFFENNLLLAAVGVDPENSDYDLLVPAIPPGFVGFKYETIEPVTLPFETILQAGAQLSNEPVTSTVGTALEANTKVSVFNLSKDGKWAFVSTADNRTGWLPLSTEKPATDTTPASITTHLTIPADLNQKQTQAALKSLYHLLGYGITADPLTKNMPIGPTEAPDDIQRKWIKELTSANPAGPVKIRVTEDIQLKDGPNDAGIAIPGDATVNFLKMSEDGNRVQVEYQSKKGWLPATAVTLDVWIYEKLLPAYAKLGADNSNWPATAPPWNQNPYRGIAADSQLPLEFWWQDIYGNKASDDTVSKSFPVRYTDALIGINQWPSLNEQYQFVRDTQGLWLEIEFIFSPAPYEDLKLGITPNQKEVLARRLKADLSTYQKLYYQLHGPGLSFEVTTSLDDAWSNHFLPDQNDRNGTSLSAFVLHIYEYLTGLNAKLEKDDLGNVPGYTGSAYALKINLGTLKPKNTFIQGVSCWMTMLRNTKFVHTDLEKEDKLKNIFENKAVLSPKHEVVEYAIQANQTLQTLADGIKKNLDTRQKQLNLLATNNTITPDEIVLQYRALPATVRGEKEINIDDLTLADGVTFGAKRKELALQEEPRIGKTDPVTGQVITRTDGLYADPEKLKFNTISGGSFEALVERIDQKMKTTFGPRYPVTFTLADLADNFKEKDFLQAGAKLTLEPLNIRMFAHHFSEAFPDFHITVSEESNAGGGQANPEDGKPEFLFAVRLGGTGIRYDITDQTPNFYAIPPVSTQLFSGKATIFSDPEKKTGAVEKEVEGVDANVLVREFLSALEEMLKPEFLAPANKMASETTQQLLGHKFTLAQKIAGTVAPILAEDFGDPKVSPDPRLQAAKEAIQQRLLHNLLEGFDIESIVQYEATITTGSALPAKTAPVATLPPRMTGKAKVLRVRVGEKPDERVPAQADDLDYTLSTGYFELDQRDGQSAFTCLFDTKTPDKFSGLEMEMEFQPLEMEFNLTNFPDTDASFESSNKLHFILPANLNVYRIDQALIDKVTKLFEKESEFKNSFATILPGMVGKKFFSLAEFEAALSVSLPAGKTLNDAPYRTYCDALLSDANPNYMGRTAVPIPLRYYPLSPSLILQQAEADESSRGVIRDLREWRYTIIYEHPEIAQDSIDYVLRLNVPDTEQAAGNDSIAPVEVPELVRLLLNFKENLPGMKAAITPLKAGNGTDAAKTALKTFAFLTGQIAANWEIVRTDKSKNYEGDLHFEVSEETLTYVGNTREAETREGIVITQKGLAEADLIQLDRNFVEKEGVPGTRELLKMGIIKSGAGYFKQLVPMLELPGFFLQAKFVELDKATVEKNGVPTEAELAKQGIIRQGEAPDYTYLIRIFPDPGLPPHQADPLPVGNPGITATVAKPECRTFFFAIDPDDQRFFGDSSIPDRKFSIENLDLLQQQNAWASIWLSRNKNLVYGKTTNADFIFRTPAVRFSNRITPSIVNRKPWDIATLPAGGSATKTTLAQHLTNMIALFTPGVANPKAKHQRYELQIACRYAYAIARGSGLNEDLITTLPILLGLRLTAGQLNQYPGKLSTEISTWFQKQQPAETNASLIFSVEAYSQLDPNANSSLPLLRVTHLELDLNNITNMPDIRIGNG